MMTTEETGHKLEALGIEACEALEEAIATPGLGPEVPYRFEHLILTGDAYAQHQGLPPDNSPDRIGALWVASVTSFADKAIQLGRVTRSFTRIRMLFGTNLLQLQIVEGLQTREELFKQNPDYHGRRFGPDYSQAVASGKLRLKP